METIANYFKDRQYSINIILVKHKGTYTTGTFHKLRVEIKRLDAIFGLIEFCSKDFKRKKIFKPFRKIFVHAGKVRNLQIMEAKFKSYFALNMLKKYQENLREQRLKETEEFYSVANEKLVKQLKKTFKKINPVFSQVNGKKANSYLAKKKKKIEKLIGQELTEASGVHALRKQLKGFYYIRESLQQKQTGTEPVKKDILPELLGKWNDCQEAIGHLNKAIKTKGINLKELGKLEEIKTKISSEGDILFNKIKEAIPLSEFFVVTQE